MLLQVFISLHTYLDHLINFLREGITTTVYIALITQHSKIMLLNIIQDIVLGSRSIRLQAVKLCNNFKICCLISR